MPQSLLPESWDVPPAFHHRLGARPGRQRLMQHDGHLLLLLHQAPQPTDPDRAARFFWRKPDGSWRSHPEAGGDAVLRRHLQEYQDVIEFSFERFSVPAVGAIDLTVTAQANGRSDAVRRSLPVRPWGLPYAAHGGGTAQNDAHVRLTLPGGLAFASRWMTVTVGPSVEQSIIDMAMGAGAGPRPLPAADRVGPIHPAVHFAPEPATGSELLAALSGLEYASRAKASEADRRRLWERCASLISGLVMSQRDDGGWGWRRAQSSGWWESSINFWALSRARQHGLSVDAGTLKRAETYLLNQFQSVGASEHTAKAIILHALSAGNAAKFELANSLYRERNRLEPIALACTAMTLANLDRKEIAAEVLQVLEGKAVEVRPGGRRLCSWKSNSDRYPWISDEITTTAIALLALQEVTPNSPRIEPAVQFLLDRRGCFGFSTGQGRGAAVRALARYFSSGRFAGDDYRLTVYVNDEAIETIERKRGGEPVSIDVPPALLADGANDVRFEIEGRGTYTYAATLRGFSPQFKDPKSWTTPYVRSRRYLHAPLTYRNRPINAQSTSPVENVEIGQRVVVSVDLHNRSHNGYLVIEEPIPAGMTYVPGSLTGNFVHHEVRDGRLVMYVPRGPAPSDYRYELVGFASGGFRVLPTVIRDANDPSRMRIGAADDLIVLAPGEESDDPYKMNDGERFTLGKAYFDDGQYAEALGYLWPLFDRERKYQERDVARMLLWIHTAPDYYDATRVVDTFEVLSVRHPELTIPFDKILIVGTAYRDLGEYERAWIVFRATIDSSFLSDSSLSAVLEDEGQLLASIDYQESLWWEYPDTAEVASSYFALSQMLYENAPKAKALADALRTIDIEVPGRGNRWGDDRPTRLKMIAAAIELIDDFMTLYPVSPLGDDAGFSMANAYLDLKDYDTVVQLSNAYRRHFRESEFASSFQYMVALGHFWKRDYEPALDAARVVADGDSKDRDFARYILGQIYHAQEKPADAMTWYRTVDGIYPDAREAIDYFEEKRIALDEVTIFRPGEDVELPIDYRNISDLRLQVYKVDLMKLYLREKNLSNITEINLAGIEPQLVKALDLGDGRDYVDKEKLTDLELADEGAYLVICRGDDLFTSGLVLITPLKIEVQEETASGRVRVNLIDEIEGLRPAGVHVKAIGSADSEFRGGETDLRGIFVADAIRNAPRSRGAVAHLAERLNGIQEVRGSIPLGSTTSLSRTQGAFLGAAPSRPLTSIGGAECPEARGVGGQRPPRRHGGVPLRPEP